MRTWAFGFIVALLAHRAVTDEGLGSAAEEDEDCECVPYYQCQNGTIIEDGSSIIDIRLRVCDHYLDVCCGTPTIEVPTTPLSHLTTEEVLCGRRNPNGLGFRITGAEDNEANFGEFPWMVAVMRIEAVDPAREREGSAVELTEYQCGGSLIHPKVVLTAAHCVAGKENLHLMIRAGEWDTQTTKEELPFQERDVDYFVIHEHYREGNLFNDVALLFLSQPVDPTENIGFACIPQQAYLPPPGTRCFATGWGKNVFGKDGLYQTILKKIDLPVVGSPACQDKLRQTRLGGYFRLHQSFMCAGGEEGKDSCKGDGGSPLVCPSPENPEIYIQSGIVAWGIGCGGNDVPGVYVNVGLFRNWIDGKMVEARLETSSYSN